MLSTRRWFANFILAWVIGVVPLQAQGAQLKYDPAKFITKKQLQMRGNITIAVRGVGQFEIQKLMVRGDGSSNCAVEINSLKTLVRKAAVNAGGRLSPGSKIKISMDKTGCTGPNGEILLCCMNDGTSCTVDLGVKQLFKSQVVAGI